MKNKELGVGFNPPQEEVEADGKTELILELVKEKGCSYPAEIGGLLDISKDTVYRKLRFLENQGEVKREALAGKTEVPEWLQPRIKELWSRGIKGEAIRRMSWYRLTKEGEKHEKDTA